MTQKQIHAIEQNAIHEMEEVLNDITRRYHSLSAKMGSVEHDISIRDEKVDLNKRSMLARITHMKQDLSFLSHDLKRVLADLRKTIENLRSKASIEDLKRLEDKFSSMNWDKALQTKELKTMVWEVMAELETDNRR